MNKKQLTVTSEMRLLLLPILTLFLIFPFFIYAEERDTESQADIINDIANTEIADMNAGLKNWTDETTIKNLTNVPLNKDFINNLYFEFRTTIVDPPNPETYVEYSIPNAGQSLAKINKLGREIHNLLLALSDEDINKYGALLHVMRDVLYLDSKHIPLAIKRDRSRNVLWYQLHTKWVNEAEKEYSKLFKNE